MGYRSDVGVVFYTLNEEKVPFGAVKLWFDENYPHEDAAKAWLAEITFGKDYIYVSYQDVKWFDSYEHPVDVSEARRKFIAAFRGDDENPIYKFVGCDYVCIGEEDTDIESDYSDYSDYRLRVRREITLD